ITPVASAAMPRTQPTPSVSSIQEQLRALAVRNTRLVEQVNRAEIDAQAGLVAANVAAATARAAHSALHVANAAFAAEALTAYEDGPFSTVRTLLSSGSGNSYLDGL